VEQRLELEQKTVSDSEIASRIARYERGEAKLIPAADVFDAAKRLTASASEH
jgi:hypothetical protein